LHRTRGRTLRIALQGGPFASHSREDPSHRTPGRTLRIAARGLSPGGSPSREDPSHRTPGRTLRIAPVGVPEQDFASWDPDKGTSPCRDHPFPWNALTHSGGKARSLCWSEQGFAFWDPDKGTSPCRDPRNTLSFLSPAPRFMVAAFSFSSQLFLLFLWAGTDLPEDSRRGSVRHRPLASARRPSLHASTSVCRAVATASNPRQPARQRARMAARRRRRTMDTPRALTHAHA